MKVWLVIIFVLVFGLIGLTVFNAAREKNGEDLKTEEATSAKTEELKGFSLSPKSFTAPDFTDFFVKANEGGDSITGWAEIEQFANAQSVPYVVAGLAKQYSYEPIILVGLKNSNSFSDYEENLVSFVKDNKIDYLGIGVEVNRYTDYEGYVNAYASLYDKVKEVSPNTKIFTVYQYETFLGLNGGLFGGVNDEGNAQWDRLDDISSDMIGFTTYPGLIYKDPNEIPVDYYAKITQHTTKPIIFTEIGWFREGPTGWESSAKEQAQFVEKYFDLTKELDVKANIWTFLYDSDSQEFFRTMGLLKDNEETSLAFEAWKNSN